MTWSWYMKLIFQACLTACVSQYNAAHNAEGSVRRCVPQCETAAVAEQRLADRAQMDADLQRLNKSGD